MSLLQYGRFLTNVNARLALAVYNSIAWVMFAVTTSCSLLMFGDIGSYDINNKSSSGKQQSVSYTICFDICYDRIVSCEAMC